MVILVKSLPQRIQQAPVQEILELTWDERCKPRRKFTTDQGTEIALSLERGTILADGCTVYSSPERTVVVKAKPESVVVIQPESRRDLAEVAHHLGNWHRSVQIDDDGSLIAESDRPLIDWLRKRAVPFRQEMKPYEPNLRTTPHG